MNSGQASLEPSTDNHRAGGNPCKRRSVMPSQHWLPIVGYSKSSLTQRWRQGIRAACVGVALLSLSACAGRYLGTPSTGDLPHLGLSTRTKELSVTLNHVITPNGPGSWVKAARWDEY